ncbi:unnamed protein product [Rhizophagus irregularis]|nr:unnamed protein product [Rhizophagus irregularis]
MELSYKTYNSNNGYELDIQPEDEKKSGDKGSDDMEGVENINVLDVEDIDILEDEDLYNDDDHVEEDKLELKKGMTFEIWKIAETYLENFAKQQGFSFRKRRREIDPIDNITIRKRTFECSHARTHDSDKAILNRKDRNSEMIGCLWHFELEWNVLINKYPECQQYLTRVLYPCKTSWASYAINCNFTAGIQSSQCAEVSNKIIKEKLNRTSRISEVVEEVQAIFDKQSKKAVLTECMNEISTRGLPSIMEEYFPGLDTLTDDFYQTDIAREDDYNQPQSLLSLLLGNIVQHNVQEVWKIFFLSQPSFQHLEKVRQMPNIKQLQGPKQKFGFGIGYAKKALDYYAIRADKLNELVSQLESFIEEMKEELSINQENIDSIVKDPIQVKHKRRQPNRYKSGGETS